MRTRACALLLAGLVALPVLARAGSPEGKVGKPASAFSLKDTAGKEVSLADFKDKKAVVVIFVGTECPINNAYMPRLAALSNDYAAKDVQFLAINSNRQDTVQRVADHAQKNALPFPVLKDEGNVVADQFGARRTPEVFLLDSSGTIRYQGRIDDQFGIGYQRAKPTRRDLAEAIDEVLAGKVVAQPTTSVAGCLIGRVTEPKADGTVTFTKQIARILQKNCQECHRPGQIGPMPLLTYEDAAAWSATIREVIADNRMPPWYADPRYGHFSNDRRLAAEEREALLAWIDQGTPKGKDEDLPPPRQFVAGWRIGQPDLVFTMAEEFTVPAEAPKAGVPYKYFSVDTNFQEDRWVVRAEAKPGAPGVVHHIVVFIAPPGQPFRQDGSSRVLCGTAPGDMPLILPPGKAKKVPAGSRLVFQMHYTPNGSEQKDRSSVGLIFAKEPPERAVLTRPVSNPRFVTRRDSIPPGADNYQVEAEFTFPEDGHILSFMPHMHLRGKDFLIEVTYPDGKTETVLSVPRYNFGWQSSYRYATAVPMPKGSKVHCIAHFDNSDKNPNNPDPTQRVYWGDQTWEEMMIGWMDFVYDRKPE
jgi:peroxiredoxin